MRALQVRVSTNPPHGTGLYVEKPQQRDRDPVIRAQVGLGWFVGSGGGGLAPRRLRLVQDYIEANLADEITLAILRRSPASAPRISAAPSTNRPGSPRINTCRRRNRTGEALLAEGISRSPRSRSPSIRQSEAIYDAFPPRGGNHAAAFPQRSLRANDGG